MTDAETMRAVCMRYFNCLDTENWDGMRECWTEDGTLKATGGRPRSNREEVIEYFAKIFVPWQVHEDRPIRLVISEPDQTVMAEVQFSGTTADGREVVFDAIDVFDFSPDGRIRKLSNWYDIDYARRMVAPPKS